MHETYRILVESRIDERIREAARGAWRTRPGASHAGRERGIPRPVRAPQRSAPGFRPRPARPSWKLPAGPDPEPDRRASKPSLPATSRAFDNARPR